MGIVVIIGVRCVCPTRRRHVASVATAASAGAVGRTALPRQVRSPPRRSCGAAWRLCLLSVYYSCAPCVV